MKVVRECKLYWVDDDTGKPVEVCDFNGEVELVQVSEPFDSYHVWTCPNCGAERTENKSLEPVDPKAGTQWDNKKTPEDIRGLP